MFLTSDEIAELTGYKQRSSQLKWLTKNGFKFVIGGDGKPRVTISQVESRIGAGSTVTAKRRTEPNFEKFEKVLNGA